MPYELFTFSGTPFGWRVQLTALLKQIELEIQWLQPSPDVLKGDEFLALNPRGRVPALRSGDFVLYESAAIVSYLDARHPSPPLFGKSAEAGALVRQVVSEVDCYLSRDVPAFAGVIFTGRAEAAWDEVSAAGEACLGEFDHHERVLGTRPFLALGELSAADVMLYPLVAGFLRAAGKPVAASLAIPAGFPKRFPKISEWMRRIEAIPNFASTLPPGWR